MATKKTHVARALCCYCCFCWLVSSVCGQIFSPWQQRLVDTVAREVMSCGRIPGLSLSVVRGADSWTLPLGVTNLTSQAPIQNETRFAIGSLTKAFTSTLVVSLLAQSPNNWTLDTPLAVLLENPELFGDELRSSQASVKDVLSHRVGLARADLALFAGFPAGFILSDMVSGLPCLPEQKPFRGGYVYSNFLYSLAGHVVEKLANQSFAQALNSHLLEPLGMTSTGPYHPGTSLETNSPDRQGERGLSAVPYVIVKDKLVPADPKLFSLDPFLPALGLASNGPDMIRWLKLQLGRDVSQSSRENVLPRGVLAATHEPVTPHIVNNLRPRFPQPDLTFAYGLGWQQAVYKGFRRAWHSGSLFGFASQIWLFPDLGLGLFVAANGPARSPDTQNRLTALLYYVTDLMLGDRPWLDEASACSYPVPPESPASQARQDFRGVQRAPPHNFRAPNDQFPQTAVRARSDSASQSPSPSSHDGLTSSLSSLPWPSSPETSRASVGAGSGSTPSISLSSLLSSSVSANASKARERQHSKNDLTKPLFPSNDQQSSGVHCARYLSVQIKDLMRYTGVYFNKLFGNVSVTLANTATANRSGYNRATTVKPGTQQGSSANENIQKLPCRTDKNISSWTNSDSNLRIHFGVKFSGVLVYSESFGNFTDIAKTSVHIFEMVPTGIFEFSAYSGDQKTITMPVQFSDFNVKGSPDLLRAVWQEEEVLEFDRGWSSQRCTAHTSNRPYSDSSSLDAVSRQTFSFFLLLASLIAFRVIP